MMSSSPMFTTFPSHSWVRTPAAAVLAAAIVAADLVSAACAVVPRSEGQTATASLDRAAPEVSSRSGTTTTPIRGRPVDTLLPGPRLYDAPRTRGDQGYDLRIDVPRELEVDVPAVARVSVGARDTWSLSLEYPIELLVTPAHGLRVDPLHWTAEDAVARSDRSCEFALPIEAGRAGDLWLRGELRFALCQENACVPVQKTIHVEFTVIDEATVRR
ncbi:MAG: hypothetical protein V3V08_06875 [Nannocystaceae bacterium]